MTGARGVSTAQIVVQAAHRFTLERELARAAERPLIIPVLSDHEWAAQLSDAVQATRAYRAHAWNAR